jgi:putative hydrolase of the HAD superfamily
MNIVWDFGGVVLRWRPRVLVTQALPERAATPQAADEWVKAIFQGFGGDWGEFDRGRISQTEVVQRIAQRTGLALSEVNAVVQALPEELAPQPDTVALMEALQAAGRPQYFLSNMPAPLADHIERTHAFMRHLRTGVFSGREGVIKPDPDIFALAAQRCGIEPAQSLFIDDHPANVAAAQALGWQALQFHDAAQVRDALEAKGLLAVA